MSPTIIKIVFRLSSSPGSKVTLSPIMIIRNPSLYILSQRQNFFTRCQTGSKSQLSKAAFSSKKLLSRPNMSAPPRRCWVGNAASSVCAVGQRTHPAEVQSEPHLPSDVVLGQLVTERIGLENGIVLSFSS